MSLKPPPSPLDPLEPRTVVSLALCLGALLQLRALYLFAIVILSCVRRSLSEPISWRHHPYPPYGAGHSLCQCGHCCGISHSISRSVIRGGQLSQDKTYTHRLVKRSLLPPSTLNWATLATFPQVSNGWSRQSHTLATTFAHTRTLWQLPVR